jgi:hypothetical protein
MTVGRPMGLSGLYSSNPDLLRSAAVLLVFVSHLVMALGHLDDPLMQQLAVRAQQQKAKAEEVGHCFCLRPAALCGYSPRCRDQGMPLCGPILIGNLSVARAHHVVRVSKAVRPFDLDQGQSFRSLDGYDSHFIVPWCGSTHDSAGIPDFSELGQQSVTSSLSD